MPESPDELREPLGEDPDDDPDPCEPDVPVLPEPPDEPAEPEEPDESEEPDVWEDELVDDAESPPFPSPPFPLPCSPPPSWPPLSPCPAARSAWCRAAPPAREPSPSRSDSPNVCFQFSAEDFPSSQPFFTVRPTS
ncbi:hypothetical protein ABZ641_16165, partial [Kitasatospora sp. NPDC007106]